MKVHNTSVKIYKADHGIEETQKILSVISKLPKIGSKANAINNSLKLLHAPLHKANEGMKLVEKATKPLLKTTTQLQNSTQKAIKAEESFRHSNLAYIDKVGQASQCFHNAWMIGVLNDSAHAYKIIDDRLYILNNEYDKAKQAPMKALHALLSELKSLADIDPALNTMLKRMEIYYDSLHGVLNKKVSISIPYPCGIKTCYKDVPYVCGTETCHKKIDYDCGVKFCTEHTFLGKTKYPCGTKKCHKTVSYPCGVKTCYHKTPYPCATEECHYNVSIEIKKVLGDLNSILEQLQSLMPNTVIDTLGSIGLKEIAKQLKKRAQEEIGRILDKLTQKKLPGMPHIQIPDHQLLLNLEAELSKLHQVIKLIETDLDVKKLVPLNLYEKLKAHYKEIDLRLQKCKNEVTSNK